MTMDFAIEPLAEDALLLRFGDGIDMDINARVHAAARALRAAHLPGLIDIAPAYATLLVRFDPFAWTGGEIAQPLERIAARLKQALSPERLLVRGKGLGEGVNIPQTANADGPRRASPFTLPSPPSSAMGERAIVVIPVCYGGEYGPDLEAVARHARLSRDEVIGRHVAAEYTVAMLGFAPGFPYLLGLDAALHVPRRTDPRTRVPAGSVAIGGGQTGIYPRELPGGWNLIGRTPRVLFDPERNPPCLLAPGNRMRFRAIDAQAFARFAERQA